MGTPLDSARYINLETFKKNGDGVKTPVWSAPLDGKLVVFTAGESFKVKRLGRNPKIRVAACDARGNVRADTVGHDGTGRILGGAAAERRALGALGGNYGWA